MPACPCAAADFGIIHNLPSKLCMSCCSLGKGFHRLCGGFGEFRAFVCKGFARRIPCICIEGFWMKNSVHLYRRVLLWEHAFECLRVFLWIWMLKKDSVPLIVKLPCFRIQIPSFSSAYRSLAAVYQLPYGPVLNPDISLRVRCPDYICPAFLRLQALCSRDGDPGRSRRQRKGGRRECLGRHTIICHYSSFMSWSCRLTSSEMGPLDCQTVGGWVVWGLKNQEKFIWWFGRPRTWETIITLHRPRAKTKSDVICWLT